MVHILIEGRLQFRRTVITTYCFENSKINERPSCRFVYPWYKMLRKYPQIYSASFLKRVTFQNTELRSPCRAIYNATRTAQSSYIFRKIMVT